MRSSCKREFGFKRTTAGRLFDVAGTETYCRADGPLTAWGYRTARPSSRRPCGTRRKTCLTKNLVRGARGNTQTDYLLQGIVTCAGCGRLLAARTRREKSGRTFCDITDAEATPANVEPRPYIRAD